MWVTYRAACLLLAVLLLCMFCAYAMMERAEVRSDNPATAAAAAAAARIWVQHDAAFFGSYVWQLYYAIAIAYM